MDNLCTTSQDTLYNMKYEIVINMAAVYAQTVIIYTIRHNFFQNLFFFIAYPQYIDSKMTNSQGTRWTNNITT